MNPSNNDYWVGIPGPLRTFREASWSPETFQNSCFQGPKSMENPKKFEGLAIVQHARSASQTNQRHRLGGWIKTLGYRESERLGNTENKGWPGNVLGGSATVSLCNAVSAIRYKTCSSSWTAATIPSTMQYTIQYYRICNALPTLPNTSCSRRLSIFQDF